MQTRMPAVFIVALVVASTVSLGQRPSADWPQWRGPNRDGSAPSFVAPKNWPESLTQKWKVEVGLGYASPLVIGDRVFAFTRQSDDEVVTALEAATGKTIWSAKYAAQGQNRAVASHS